ncbi:hypothetical protein [Mycobacterium phage Maco7]|nr:hypothetical protein [Mycobacterium phage Maco7]
MKYHTNRNVHPRDMTQPHRVSYIRRSIRVRYAGLVYIHSWSPVYGWVEHSVHLWASIPHIRTRGITFKVVVP